MRGTSHAVVGGVVGGLVSLGVGNEPVGLETGTLVVLGSVAGLIPDLDTNGKLSNKITFSHKIIKIIMVIVGLLIMAYSFLNGEVYEKIVGIVIGLGVIGASKYITQKRMLLVTGIGVLILGITLSKLWVLLLGVYIGIASMVGHRTYTHTVWGLIYFGYIAHLVSIEYSQINGLFLVLVLGYISHLVCDFKIFNKQGVKLFRPFLKVEI